VPAWGEGHGPCRSVPWLSVLRRCEPAVLSRPGLRGVSILTAEVGGTAGCYPGWVGAACRVGKAVLVLLLPGEMSHGARGRSGE